MKVNLSVFSYAQFRGKLNIIHNIKELFRMSKYVKQRATRGYCDEDVWDLDTFYLKLFYSSLHTLLEHHGNYETYPTRKFDSYEEWSKYINAMRAHFYNSIQDAENTYATNIVQNALKKCDEVEKIEDALERENSIDGLYENLIDVTNEAGKFMTEELHRGLTMMEEVFYNLWW